MAETAVSAAVMVLFVLIAICLLKIETLSFRRKKKKGKNAYIYWALSAVAQESAKAADTAQNLGSC